jgi:large repetitive protein
MGARSAENSTWSDGIVLAKSRSCARSARIGLIVALALASGYALVSADAASATAPVTLDQPAPSRETTPVFSGTAAEAGPVTVEVYLGGTTEGQPVAIATAEASGGRWTSEPASPPLREGDHSFTAVAVLDNTREQSAPVTFVVDTLPPAVTLQSPPSPSRDSTPAFSGMASETTEVTVDVYAGTSPEGEVVASVNAQGTGEGWESASLTPPLADGTYTAVARQPSAIGNEPGVSEPVTFTVDTASPTVTLKQLPSPSPGARAIFSGAASDDTPVTVYVYSGAKAEGAVAATATGAVTNGRWVSERLETALPWGEYTAVATQPSSIGNAGGTSPPMTFVLEPIAPAVATEGAADVTRSSAALYASVDPLGGDISKCEFEYGTSPAYGTTIECGFVSGSTTAFPEDGAEVVPVFVRVYGLSPSTTYHYRIVVAGEGGTGRGADATFTTQEPFRFDESDPPAALVAPAAPATKAGLPSGSVAALIARQLSTAGRRATIASLLKTGAFKMAFTAPEAGTAAVGWYYLPPASKHAGKSSRTRVLVASGRLAFHAPGRRSLTIRLTSAGRRLLRRRPRSIGLTATCVFTPAAGKPVRTSRAFELKR